MRVHRSRTIDRGSLIWSAGAAGCALLPLLPLLPAWLTALNAALLAAGVALGLRGRLLPGLLRWLATLTLAGLILWHYGVVFGGHFGRDTGTALLSAMLALKLLELRTLRDARILICVAMFALMAAFLHDRGPLTLTLALLATLASLAALARVAEHEVAAPGAPPVMAGPQRLALVARVVLVSLPLALAAFFLFPRLSQPLWGMPENAREARTGISDEMGPGDIARLYMDDSPMLRVRFDGPPPPNPMLYWRGPVLMNFDGRRWTRSPWTSALPGADLIIDGEPIRYEVQQEPSERSFVFALDVPTAPISDGRFTLERTMLSPRPLNDVTLHRLESVTRYRLQPSLPRTMAFEYTRLPTGFNPRAIDLARQWRAQAGGDDLQVIQAALALFNAHFSYTLEPELLGRHSVDEFLFETRAGYCEHYASAFAVLMRAAGIPTRVVTGYQGGVVNPIGNYVLVRQSDAHAWNEVWLPDQGWVRIDPTSAVAPHRIERGFDALGERRRRDARFGQALFDAADWMRRGWNQFVLGYDAVRQRQLLDPFGIDARDWRQLGAAFAIGVAIAVALTLVLLLRRPPPSKDPLFNAWHRFRRRLRRAGVAKLAHEGPTTYARRAAAALPDSAAEITALGERYVRLRYAALAANDADVRRLCADLRGFRIARRSR